MGDYETTLLVKPQCFVYKPPPRTEARGYRAKEWNLSTPLWTGRLVIKSKGQNCVIHLENDDGSDFATCPVYNDKRGPEAVEKVLDSSRYFVLRIEDSTGRAAFIGMGFNERNDAFDFTAAIQDHEKYFEQQKELERTAVERAKQPAKDYSLKQGETLKISIPTKKSGAAGGKRNRRNYDDDDDEDDDGFLPPPPDFDSGFPAPPGEQQAPPPQQVQQPQQQQVQQVHQQVQQQDIFAGFGAPPPQGQQQQPFGGQQQQPFGGQQQQPFGGQQQQPFGGQQQPFGGQQQPFGGQQQPFGGQQQQPFGGQQQQPFGAPAQQPFGGSSQQPFGGPQQPPQQQQQGNAGAWPF